MVHLRRHRDWNSKALVRCAFVYFFIIIIYCYFLLEIAYSLGSRNANFFSLYRVARARRSNATFRRFETNWWRVSHVISLLFLWWQLLLLSLLVIFNFNFSRFLCSGLLERCSKGRLRMAQRFVIFLSPSLPAPLPRWQLSHFVSRRLLLRLFHSEKNPRKRC